MPFRSYILVENPSRLTTLSGEGRVMAKIGIAIKERRIRPITAKKANLESLAIFLALEVLELEE